MQSSKSSTEAATEKGMSRLTVERLPKRPGLYPGLVEKDPQGLDVVPRLKTGAGLGSLVGILLPTDPDRRVDRDSSQPEIAVVTWIRIVMDLYSGDIRQKLAVQFPHTLPVGDMLLEDRHLPQADAGAHIGEAVVVADSLMLVKRVFFPRLGRIPLYLFLLPYGAADEGPAA